MLAPSNVRIHFVLLLFSAAIFTIIVRGIDNSIPTGPNTHPQKIKDTNTINDERSSFFPMYFGSIIFPIKTYAGFGSISAISTCNYNKIIIVTGKSESSEINTNNIIIIRHKKINMTFKSYDFFIYITFI